MPRRGQVIKREMPADAKHQSVTVSRLINRIMVRGQKLTATRIVYDALDIIEQQEGKSPAAILEQAVRNVTPLLEVKPRRVGGATYQVPIEVRPERSLSLAMRWLAKGRGRLSKSVKILREWLRQIEPLPITDGKG